MREIKFRAWDKRMNKMFYGETDGWSWFSDVYMPPNDYGDSFLMQFTGLKDMNGKEIYEGDRVKTTSKNGNKTIYEVVWSEDRAGFMTKNKNIYSKNKGEAYFYKGLGFVASRGEVIGNIYENSDLLK